MDFQYPMLLEKADEHIIQKPHMIIEPKIDGIRGILSTYPTFPLLHTRHKTNITKRFPEIISSIQTKEPCLLDGEIYCVDPSTGLDDWELTMDRFHLHSNEFKIQYAVRENPAYFVIFDILYYGKNETNAMKLPLWQRKELLQEMVVTNAHIQLMFFSEVGKQVHDVLKSRGHEGLVVKNKNSLYYPAARREWGKFVFYKEYKVVLTGFRHKGEFGVLCAFAQGDKLKPAGVIEFMAPEHRKTFFRYAYQNKIKEDQMNVYVHPTLNGIVKTRGLTRNGYLRTPVFVEYSISN
ncbi:hypothetical protein ACFSCX_06330 [Bacillus salitolerans]|uniref:ATP-dependent DNA ligase family profile domain-containing protein n=1 Tax=Bacillus salitolerans TaxID=1437434 RepID=A0ABW4LN45_9BACI